MGGKKQKWRRIETVADTAAEDVTAAAVARITGAGTSFVLDTDGCLAKGKLAHKLARAKAEGVKVENLRRVLQAKEKAKKYANGTLESHNKRTAEKGFAVFDVWGADLPESYKQALPVPPQKRARRTDATTVAVAAVALPLAGQSVNPSPEDLRSAVRFSAANVNKELQENSRISESLNPLVSELKARLPTDTVESMSFVEMQRSFAALQKVSDDAAIDEVIATALNQPDAESGKSDEEGGRTKEAENAVRKPTKPKTRKQKRSAANRRARERELLEKKKARDFNFQINQLRKMVEAAETTAARTEARKNYLGAIKKAEEEALKRGVRLRPLKLGRYKFEEPIPELILSSEHAEAGGSLRRLKLRSVAGTNVHERCDSVLRRGIDLCNKLTPAEFEKKKKGLFRMSATHKVSLKL